MRKENEEKILSCRRYTYTHTHTHTNTNTHTHISTHIYTHPHPHQHTRTHTHTHTHTRTWTDGALVADAKHTVPAEVTYHTLFQKSLRGWHLRMYKKRFSVARGEKNSEHETCEERKEHIKVK
jgi:hypothetical protein